MRKDFDADDIMGDLGRIIGEDFTRIGLRALSAVVLATPVGNPTLWQRPESAPPGYVGGHARRNWNVTAGTPKDDEIPGEDSAGAATIAEGSVHVRAWGAELARTLSNLARPLFIQNAVPYMGRLNVGHSTQAPAGFIEKAVQAADPGMGFSRVEV